MLGHTMRLTWVGLLYVCLPPSLTLKNVLLVVVDDMRPQLGSYECVDCHLMNTPNMDALAAIGVSFTRAFANQALCGPSRTSFLTSRRPDKTRLLDQGSSYWRHDVANFSTIPQMFKESGYDTVSFGKVFHPGRASGHHDDYPYSWSQPPFHPPSERFKNAPTCPGLRIVGQNPETTYANLACAVNVSNEPTKMLPDDETIEAALQFVSRRDSARPLFLAVGFHKPHVPFKIPLRYLELYPESSIHLPSNRNRSPTLPEVAWNPWNDLRRRDDVSALGPPFPFGPLSDDYQKVLRRHYFAAISYVDDLFGDLMSGLHSIDPGWMDNTVILLTSDHGWSLGEHGEWAKYGNFDEATRVPLILFDPEDRTKREDFVYRNPFHSKVVNGFRSPVGKRSDRLIELVDLMPTLSELALGRNVPSCPDNTENDFIKLCTDGQSFASELRSPSQSMPERAIFTQFPRPGPWPTVEPDSDQPRRDEIKIMGYSIRTIAFRYTEWMPFNATNMAGMFDDVLSRELYDLDRDPGENLNVVNVEAFASIASRLSLRLKKKFQNIITNTV